MKKSLNRSALLGVLLLGMLSGAGVSYYVVSQLYDSALNTFIDYELDQYEDLAIHSFSDMKPSDVIHYQSFLIKILDNRHKAKWISERDYMNKIGLSYARIGYLYKILNNPVKSDENIKIALQFLSGTGTKINSAELMDAMSSLHKQ